MEAMKRISQIVQKEIVKGPYGEAPVYSLARSDSLFGADMRVTDWSEVEGENGKYLHILLRPTSGKGPKGETGDFVVSTGAMAIMNKLAMAGKESLPFVLRFEKKTGRANRTWYDIV